MWRISSSEEVGEIAKKETEDNEICNEKRKRIKVDGAKLRNGKGDRIDS
jgi:hypothetical protein